MRVLYKMKKNTFGMILIHTHISFLFLFRRQKHLPKKTTLGYENFN